MNINIQGIEETVFEKFKGGDGNMIARMFFDGTNRIMKARLEPGASIGMHTHDTSCEVILITSGYGCVMYDGQRIPLTAGDVHYCPKGHTHSLMNDSGKDLEFFAVVPQQ